MFTAINTHYVAFLVCCFLLCALGCQRPEQAEKTPSPNIVIILADDMGYSDIGSYGGEIATPNLDALAANGLRFHHFYNAARCCPTRAALLTGVYPHEAGMGGMVSSVDSDPPPGPYQGFLSDSTVTCAELLREAGYATYMAGKWHVGEKPEHWPRQRGFDRYFGLISGASSYYELVEEPRVRQLVLDDSLWFPPAEGFYMTDAFTDYADEFLTNHFSEKKEQPFLLYLAYTAPHWPLHALPEDIASYENRYTSGWDSLRQQRYEKMLRIGAIDTTFTLSPWDTTATRWDQVTNRNEWVRRMQVYAAMVDRMDQNIGRVFQTLKENNAWDNTLILFLSDNGGCAEDISGRNLNDPSVPIGARGSYVAYRKPWAVASNTPFRRYKQWTEEGGIATPLIAHWPAGISRKNEWVQPYAHVVDIMATCAEVAGIPYPTTYQGHLIKPQRGQSLLPLLTGDSLPTPSRPLYWEHFGNQAMRQGPWKLISHGPDYQWSLFNMREDPTELHDVAVEYPRVLQEMAKEYEDWASAVGVVKRVP